MMYARHLPRRVVMGSDDRVGAMSRAGEQEPLARRGGGPLAARVVVQRPRPRTSDSPGRDPRRDAWSRAHAPRRDLPLERRCKRARTCVVRGASPLQRLLEIRPSADELRLVVAYFGGNVSRTAAFFCKERRQIYRWAERYEIDLGKAREE